MLNVHMQTKHPHFHFYHSGTLFKFLEKLKSINSIIHSFGSRVCIGKRLANLEIEVLVARLIRDYKLEWNLPELKFKAGVVNIPDGDIKFKMTKV